MAFRFESIRRWWRIKRIAFKVRRKFSEHSRCTRCQAVDGDNRELIDELDRLRNQYAILRGEYEAMRLKSMELSAHPGVQVFNRDLAAMQHEIASLRKSLTATQGALKDALRRNSAEVVQ